MDKSFIKKSRENRYSDNEAKSPATTRNIVHQMLKRFSEIYPDILQQNQKACRDHLFFLAKILEKEVNKLTVNNMEMTPTLRALLSYLLLELASVNGLHNPRRGRRRHVPIFPF
jgi:hypothetical protein